MRLSALAIVTALGATPAFANDTTAELATGGLIFTRSDWIEMQSEDLYISPSEVRITYEFRNRGNEDIESVVAFPMPEISANPYAMQSIPEDMQDNFLGFTVEADGRTIEPELDQRAFAAEVDVTELLRENGIPLFPYGKEVAPAIEKLPQDVREEWVTLGILFPEEYDDGSGMRKVWSPYWRLRSTYWWRMTFPADETITVRHNYTPSVGGTVGTTFLDDGKARGERFEDYQRKYCLEGGILKAVEASAAKDEFRQAAYYETWISYVLTTGGNWATSIGKFRLTIDKGSPQNLVSFCGTGVKKTGPTTFVMEAEDFYPERDLDILILQPLESAN